MIARQDQARSGLPKGAVPFFGRRFAVETQTLRGRVDFASHVITARRRTPTRTIVYVHGGGFMAGIDPFHLRYVTRLAEATEARIVLPDYPVAPRHTWRDSFEPLLELVQYWSATPGGAILGGDSAGGGYALALALAARDAGSGQPSKLLLHAPWVDLTTSTPETADFAVRDPWLFLGKTEAYAGWWAGVPEDLGRPEVSPGLADLSDLPPALMLYGTRDLLAPGCRLLVRRAAEAGWDLTAIEEPDLLHVYSLMPLIPEARRAWRQTLAFLK